MHRATTDTGLHALLEQLDPARTLEQTAARADEAMISFRSCPAQVTQWREFQALSVEFLRHVEGRVLRLRGGPWVSFEHDWGRCAHLLMTEFGGSSGDKAAFELARTGNEGGLYHVLRKLASRLAEEYAGNEIRARISDWWNRLTVTQKFAAMDEYLAAFGHVLPSELIEDTAARLRASFPKVLAQHPYLMQRFRQVGR